MVVSCGCHGAVVFIKKQPTSAKEKGSIGKKKNGPWKPRLGVTLGLEMGNCKMKRPSMCSTVPQCMVRDREETRDRPICRGQGAVKPSEFDSLGYVRTITKTVFIFFLQSSPSPTST